MRNNSETYIRRDIEQGASETEFKRREFYVQFKLVSRLSPQKLRFDPRLVRMDFVVDKVSVGQTSVSPVSINQSMPRTHISFSHSPYCLHNLNNGERC
jgi:hypothetical protein